MTETIWHEQAFRATDDFIVARPFRLSGVDQKPGEPFDKSTVDEHLLRCLYEDRRIVRAPEAKTPRVALELGLLVRDIGDGKFCVMQGSARITEPKTQEEAEADLAILAS